MKIQVYDHFDNFEHFKNIFKGILTTIEKKNAKVATMVVYATLVDDEGKKIEFKDDSGERLGMIVGKFPWIDKGEGHEDWWFMQFVTEEGMLSQNEYSLRCLHENNDEKLKSYLPITRHSKCGNKRIFNTLTELNKNNYSSYYLLQAIKNGTVYRNYTWTSEYESR